MHNSISKKLLAGALSVMMVLSLVAPTNSQAASKYTLTNKTSVKAGTTYKYQLKGVKTSQYVKVTRNVSGEKVKYNKKSVTKNTKIKGTGKTLKLFVTYGEKNNNYTGKVTVKIYNKKTNKVVKTIVEKVSVKSQAEDADEDQSTEVKLVDDYGLQSNGTGIITDKLRVTFGADFGAPKAITWYRNGAVLTSVTSEVGVDQNLTHVVDAADGIGTYYAAVIDANGKSHKTNEIVISDKEDKAVIESFTIEDDYTDGKSIVYNSKDTKAVATVTMTKNYQGTFKVYKKADTKYSSLIDSLDTADNNPTNSASKVTSVANGKSVLTTDAGTNFNVLEKTAGSGLGHIARDGKVTYKFAVNEGLERGAEYVVVFDQKSVVEDNIGRGSENKFATAVTAPYVTKPTKIEITKAAKNAPVEVTLYTGDNTVMNFAGLETAENGIAAIGAKADSSIYSATKTGVEVKDATKVTTALNGTKTLKAGVWTVEGTTVTGTDAFWFANVNFNKGIYGAEEFTLRSADKQVAYDAATAMEISYDKKAAKDVKVTLTNLRTKSTLYLVNLKDLKNGTPVATTDPTASDETAAAAFKRLYDDKNEAVASTTVEAGTASYTFTGAIKGINMGSNVDQAEAGNSYIAVLVPEDETNYSPTYTATKVDVAASLTSYKLGGTATGLKDGGTNTFKLIGLDQFGNAIRFTAFNPTVAARTAKADDPATLCDVAPTFAGAACTVASEGSEITATVVAAAANKLYVAGTTWEGELSTGQKFVVTCTKGSAAPDDSVAEFSVTLK